LLRAKDKLSPDQLKRRGPRPGRELAGKGEKKSIFMGLGLLCREKEGLEVTRRIKEKLRGVQRPWRKVCIEEVKGEKSSSKAREKPLCEKGGEGRLGSVHQQRPIGPHRLFGKKKREIRT